MDRVAEPGLAFLPLLVNVGPVGGLLQGGPGSDVVLVHVYVLKNEQEQSFLTMIRMSGLTLGISAAIRWRSSCREKSPV